MKEERESKATSSSMNKLPFSDDLVKPCHKMKEELMTKRNGAENESNDQSFSTLDASVSSLDFEQKEVNSTSLRDEYCVLLSKSHYSYVQYECLKREFTKL